MSRPFGIVIGEQHHKAKLTMVKVREIRRWHNKVGLCSACLAKMYGVHRQTIWDVVNYVTWRHVRDE